MGDEHSREEGEHPHHRQQGQVPDLRLHLQGEPELEPHHHRLQEGELHHQHLQLLLTGTEPSTRRRDPETSMSSSSTPGPPARSSPPVAWSSAGRLVNTRRFSPTPSLMTSTRTSWRTGPLTRSSLCSAREAP